MVTIVNYGLGNIRAFLNVYNRLNIHAKVATRGDDLKNAEKIILPGVGSYDYAMTKLRESGMMSELEKQVIANKVPVIGICIGMQMLAQSSEEGTLPGLGWIEGKVMLFDMKKIKSHTTLPHMGWNNVNFLAPNNLFAGIKSNSLFYFLHSYYFNCHNDNNKISSTDYAGIQFTSAVHNGNIYGIQFHPEKSHQNGIKLLHNFAIF